MEDFSNMNDMTSRDYIRVLFRQKAAILTTIMTVIATAVLVVMLKTPEFEAQVKMLISGQKHTQAEYYSDIGAGGIRSEQITLTQSQIVTSDPVLERAVSVLGLAKKPSDYEARFSSQFKKPIIKYFAAKLDKKLEKLPQEQRDAYLYRMAVEDLRDRLKVVPVRETDLFLIKVTDFNPLGAAITANVVSRSYAIFDLEQQLAEMQLKYGEKHLAVIQLKEAIDKMSKSLNGARLSPLSAIGPASVKIIEQAKVPLKPTGISRVLTIILAGFMSLFMSLMIAFAFENMDQTFKSPKEAESFLNIKYLGSLPNRPKKNHFRNLSEELYLSMKEKGVKSVLLTSARQREGVTSMITGLGITLAQDLNKRVLLIDGNIRKPGLLRKFKIKEGNEFSQILEGKMDFSQAVINVQNNLDVFSFGLLSENNLGFWKRFYLKLFWKKKILPSVLNPISALETDAVKRLFEMVGTHYDVILVDSATVGEVRETALLASLTDGMIFVVNESKTRRQVVKYALDPLKLRKINILGVVFNQRKYYIPKAIYNWV
jgi:Mrp family chromosome partitioning ATPase